MYRKPISILLKWVHEIKNLKNKKKNSYNSIIKKTNTIFIWAKDVKILSIYAKKIQMVDKHMKICLISLVIRSEM